MTPLDAFWAGFYATFGAVCALGWVVLVVLVIAAIRERRRG